MFKFEFDLDDLTDETNQQPKETQPSQAEDIQIIKDDRAQDPCVVIPFKELIDRLPPFISYSNLKINDSLSIYKRELYDAKYQTIVNLAEEEEEREEEEQDREEQEGGEDGKEGTKNGEEEKTRQKTLESLQSTSDLIPGVYEGGFKTWECSLDLATHLDPIVERLKTLYSKQEEEDHPDRKTIPDENRNQSEDILPYRILEIGCGTAVPTVSLCFKLFAFLLARNRAPQLQSSSDRQHDLESPILEILLQDFNADVLKLLTFPNILLAFYRASMMTSKLEQADVSEEREENGSSTEERMDSSEETEEDLEITDELKTDFELFLRENRIRLTLIYGPWSTFELPGALSSNLTMSVPGNSGKQRRKGCEVIMSSETLYSTASLPDLITVLLSSKINNLIHQTDDDPQRLEEGKESHSTTILIASKSVYFGVGGGTHSFVDLVENTHKGAVEFVDLDHHAGPTSTGISRVLMDVKFPS
ncbi:hypothetical protein PGT21_018885 [Puccinia graminis f. sp. tritici]|uniref:protein-histidine N-methyltransferase n=1 Tax=Puccinia graminis f. sp. tritici TaxID=56615 RepID=A0A5B0SG22_PUCGR|nr:hypothetical protein PGT21_018885 [Puccinia graminis f. sp. tritici]KAA1136183.1 hypothetical protein PGTUg99_034449 [Puccinia graminis f. sp. tritici]